MHWGQQRAPDPVCITDPHPLHSTHTCSHTYPLSDDEGRAQLRTRGGGWWGVVGGGAGGGGALQRQLTPLVLCYAALRLQVLRGHSLVVFLWSPFNQRPMQGFGNEGVRTPKPIGDLRES